jgi:hypothetical protein
MIIIDEFFCLRPCHAIATPAAASLMPPPPFRRHFRLFDILLFSFTLRLLPPFFFASADAIFRDMPLPLSPSPLRFFAIYFAYDTLLSIFFDA